MANAQPHETDNSATPVAIPAASSPAVWAAAVLLFAFALWQGLGPNEQRDFFIYRLGSQLAARGENPYDLARVRMHVAARFTADDEDTKQFVGNCGYFLPPCALVLYLPFAALPPMAANIAWALLTGIAAYFIALVPMLYRNPGTPSQELLPRLILPFLLVLNPLALAIVVVGQVSLVTVGCIAAGLLALERRRPTLATLLWIVPFVKPHLALPLIPLLGYLAGWRYAALLVLFVAGLNLLGAGLAGESPLAYLDYLEQAHKVVAFNRVERNPSLTSWNCLLHAAGGPAIELDAWTTLGGYSIWLGLIVGRIAIAGQAPSPAWLIAAAAVGSLLCAQVLRYEVVLLVLTAPWLRDVLSRGGIPASLVGWVAIGGICLQLIPRATAPGIALLAAMVLAGPAATRPRSST